VKQSWHFKSACNCDSNCMLLISGDITNKIMSVDYWQIHQDTRPLTRQIDKEARNYYLDRLIIEMTRQAIYDLNNKDDYLVVSAGRFLESLGADPDYLKSLDRNKP